LGWREGAELLEQPKHVVLPPVLNDFPVGDAMRRDAGHCYFFARSRYAQKVARVLAPGLDPADCIYDWTSVWGQVTG